MNNKWYRAITHILRKGYAYLEKEMALQVLESFDSLDFVKIQEDLYVVYKPSMF